jgi:very-short-patch-repair endonuclease
MANDRARALRSNQTNAEKRLWRQLRLLKVHGLHFRRQVPIDHLIVDFACFSARMVIEVDGGQHNMAKGRAVDEQRDAHPGRNGFKVLRFWNSEVLRNTDGVMHVILEALNLNTPTPTPPQPAAGLPASGSSKSDQTLASQGLVGKGLRPVRVARRENP